MTGRILTEMLTYYINFEIWSKFLFIALLCFRSSWNSSQNRFFFSISEIIIITLKLKKRIKLETLEGKKGEGLSKLLKWISKGLALIMLILLTTEYIQSA